MLAIVSAVVMALGTYLLTRMGVGTGYGTVIRNVIVLGLGVGTLMPLLNVAVQNAFPYEIMGMVNATQQFVSSLGGVIAAPILGSILTDTFSSQLPKALPATLRAVVGRLPAAARTKLLDPQTLTSAPAQAALRSQFTAFGSEGPKL
ncbi:drug resistance transporter, EmrB/QacA subfamily, partial [mine drainage metagenome]